MNPKVHMFLSERDKARMRGDRGVDRSLTADLMKLGIGPNETLASVAATEERRAKKQRRNAQLAQARKAKGRSQICEHGGRSDHCPECSPELLAK